MKTIFSYTADWLNEHCDVIGRLAGEIYDAGKKADKYAMKTDITDIIIPFRHLSVDENYRLVAYSDHEYHGVYSSIMAVPSNAPIPDIRLIGLGENDTTLHGFFAVMPPPETAVDPMSVVLCDGTPEGYMEAALLHDAMWNAGRACFENPVMNIDFDKTDDDWNFLVKPTEWNPVVWNEDGETRLLVFYRSEIGLLNEIFPDEYIELREYRFSDRSCVSLSDRLESSKKYALPAHRYEDTLPDGKYSCSYTLRSVCIATQKKWSKQLS